jgi:hypothetical protein
MFSGFRRKNSAARQPHVHFDNELSIHLSKAQMRKGANQGNGLMRITSSYRCRITLKEQSKQTDKIYTRFELITCELSSSKVTTTKYEKNDHEAECRP